MADLREENWDTAQNRSAETGAHGGVDPTGEDIDWLSVARSTFEDSTQWIQSSVRNQWERNLRAFSNRHPAGSKYHSDDYKHRSKVFRPKTRSTIRKGEAYVAAAFFSTKDIVEIDATDQNDPMAQAGADVVKYLLQSRLQKDPIEWFLTVVGAYQDTKNLGICCSKTWWKYEERETESEYEEVLGDDGSAVLDEEGEPVYREMKNTEVVADELRIDLIPPENMRIDPGSHWINPIDSSPYVIELIPMYVTDVKAKMKTRDPKTGAPEWHTATDAIFASSRSHDYNSTRQAREGYREDSKDTKSEIRDYDIAWVHHYCARFLGKDWTFWTLGTEHLLTDPVPTEEIFITGRPWQIGFSNVEAHKIYPASQTELTQDLQQLTNEIANQRIDNVRLSMNPQKFVRAGASVDLAALRRSSPGVLVEMKRPGGTDPDVVIERPPEVTTSAYAEQDRINVDYDEIAGSFSTSSVQTNRQLNETVGGMKMLQGGANLINDLDLRIFAITWAQPVLEQGALLIQAYETDERRLLIAGQRANLSKKINVDYVPEEVMAADLSIEVNVGVGATDPDQRLDRFMRGLMALKELFGPLALTIFDKQAITEEIFGILGHREGKRFTLFPDEPGGKEAQLVEVIQHLMKMLEDQTMDAKVKMATEHMRSKTALEKQAMADKTDLLIESLKGATAARQEDARMAGQAHETLQNQQESERQRNFDAGQAAQNRGFQDIQGHVDRAFQERQAQRAAQAQPAARGNGAA